jgi:hypothetical protein
MEKINKTYGSSELLINIGYHALPYLEILNYHIAVETNVSYPYKLQFYVGETYEELKHILTARYLCVSFKITQDLENWRSIIYY